MDRLVLPSALRDSTRVLVAGAGGGFDVYAGLPLYFALKREGKEAFLANLSFTNLSGAEIPHLTKSLAIVGPDADGPADYFPERVLARFLSEECGEKEALIYTLGQTGVEPATEAYRELARHLDIDAIVLVDGGTDILMRGDEAGLGTPCEDMVSLAAVSALDEVPTRLVVCIGFGIDAFHGVCHAHFLENVAALAEQGAFLGAIALLPTMSEARAYLNAVSHAEALTREPSIVNASIASAIEGKFGNYHRTDRTGSSKLFINPMMSLIWAFDLAAVSRASLYLPLLRGTQGIFEVMVRIEAFRKTIEHRPRTAIPH